MAFSEFVSGRVAALKWTGRALRYRNYRLFFAGQGISLIGTWMQRTALLWFVYDWTHKPLLLGLLDFSSQIPALLIAPWAGLLADHFSRNRLVVITQCAAMLQAAILATLVLTHTVEVWHLFVLSIFLGLVNGFDIPLRQSFVVEMVDDKADLGNAIALNSSIFNAARLVGPSIAGFVLAVTSAGVCFVLNSVSYIAVIWALLVMKIRPREKAVPASGGLRSLAEGFSYVWHFKSIRYVLLNLVFVGIAGSPYMTLMPVFAKDILRGGPKTLGFLIAAVGVGALVGATFLAARKRQAGLGRLIAIYMVVYSLSLIAFSHSTSLALSMGIVVFTGWGMMMVMAGTNTLIQTLVDDDKRGRVMAIYTMAFMGSGPIGSLWAGKAATHIGAPLTVWIGGLACLLASVLFLYRLREMRQEVRPLYQEMGIT